MAGQRTCQRRSSRAGPGKMQEPPKSIEEFLKFQNWLSDEMETEKNIEGCSFTGFKANELTQLPRHLDAEQIYLFILKAHNFDVCKYFILL